MWAICHLRNLIAEDPTIKALLTPNETAQLGDKIWRIETPEGVMSVVEKIRLPKRQGRVRSWDVFFVFGVLFFDKESAREAAPRASGNKIMRRRRRRRATFIIKPKEF